MSGLNEVLAYALEQVVAKGASDLHTATGEVARIRVNGSLQTIAGMDSSPWTAELMYSVLESITTPDQRNRFEDELELDLSVAAAGARFRVNVHHQDNGIGIVCRQIPTQIPSLESLGMPRVLRQFAALPRGLVLVTGPTGSGKSTTLAAMIDLINRTRDEHIITIEDPIEFVHRSKRCFITQREVGRDTNSFPEALKRALRQDPDVILVGEMRDLETISTAIAAAETGHLVFATLHTQDAQQTADRIIDMFPDGRQEQIRQELAATLRGVVSQTLLPTVSGGRIAAHEILVVTSAVANMIRSGTTHQIVTALQSGAKEGMHSLDQNLAELVHAGRVERAVAQRAAHDPQTLAGYLSASA